MFQIIRKYWWGRDLSKIFISRGVIGIFTFWIIILFKILCWSPCRHRSTANCFGRGTNREEPAMSRVELAKIREESTRSHPVVQLMSRSSDPPQRRNCDFGAKTRSGAWLRERRRRSSFPPRPRSEKSFYINHQSLTRILKQILWKESLHFKL